MHPFTGKLLTFDIFFERNEYGDDDIGHGLPAQIKPHGVMGCLLKDVLDAGACCCDPFNGLFYCLRPLSSRVWWEIG